MNNPLLLPAYSAGGSVANQQQNRIKEKIKSSTRKITTLLSEAYNNVSGGTVAGAVSVKRKMSYHKIKGIFKKSLIVPVLVLAGFAIFAIVIINNFFRNTSSNNITGNDQRIDVQKPKATQTINRLFLFPLKDDKGATVSDFKYYIQDVQLQDEIIVKGQKATAIQGRTFLIINLKITNDYNKDVSINTRDYVRLMMNNIDEKLAPDIHNDPVEIQAISTKYTRLGFPISDTDKNLQLQIGEVTGKKELIKLNLKSN